jgi:hypothetical protein
VSAALIFCFRIMPFEHVLNKVNLSIWLQGHANVCLRTLMSQLAGNFARIRYSFLEEYHAI